MAGLSRMAKSEFLVRMDGLVSIVDVRGPIDESAAAALLEFIATAATACRGVQVNLDGIDSMTPGAAAILMFGDGPRRRPDEKITLRTNGRAGRDAVLRANARRRAGP